MLCLKSISPIIDALETVSPRARPRPGPRSPQRMLDLAANLEMRKGRCDRKAYVSPRDEALRRRYPEIFGSGPWPANCLIPDYHADPRRSALFIPKSMLREVRTG